MPGLDVLLKMKFFVVTVFAVVLCGCATQTEGQPTSTGRPKMVEQDINLAAHFLNALLRPNQSEFRVIVDADSEESMGHVPLATRNRQLRERLSLLRIPPTQVIKVNIYSADFPKPWGSDHYVYSFDTKSGELAEMGRHEVGEGDSDLWIRIDHWPNGTRLVSLSLSWIKDSKDDIFHLRQGEKSFRFAVASEPLTH